MGEGWEPGTGRNKAKNQDLHLAVRDTNAARQDKRQWNPGCTSYMGKGLASSWGYFGQHRWLRSGINLDVSNSICM